MRRSAPHLAGVSDRWRARVPLPDFRSPEFLLGHVRQITDFYHPACVDRERGGFFNEFRDDGRITDRETRHLVSTTRFIVKYAVAANLLGREEYREACAHGVRFLTEAHADREHQRLPLGP